MNTTDSRAGAFGGRHPGDSNKRLAEPDGDSDYNPEFDCFKPFTLACLTIRIIPSMPQCQKKHGKQLEYKTARKNVPISKLIDFFVFSMKYIE